MSEPQKDSPLVNPLEPGVLPVPEVTEEDKEKFFKCFLSDKPYIEKVKLFNGQYVVEFKSLSVQDSDDCIQQINLDKKLGLAQANDAYMIYILQYRVGASIVSLNGIPFQPECTKEKIPLNQEDGTYYISARIKAFEVWPQYKLAGVCEAYRAFETKVHYLTTKIADDAFWKAAV